MIRRLWRRYLAAKAIQGFCANPAVFAHNGMCGWALVNCSEDTLAVYAYMIADAVIKMDATASEEQHDR